MYLLFEVETTKRCATFSPSSDIIWGFSYEGLRKGCQTICTRLLSASLRVKWEREPENQRLLLRTPSNLIKDAWASVAQCLALSFPALIFWGNSDDCSVRASNESEPALRSCTGRSRKRPLGKAPGIPTTILPAPDQSELKMPGFHRGSGLRQNNNPSLTLVVNVVNGISTKDDSQHGKNSQYTASNSG